MVEFALVAPVLIGLIGLVMSASWLFFDQSNAIHAAYAATEAVARLGTVGTDPASAIAQRIYAIMSENFVASDPQNMYLYVHVYDGDNYTGYDPAAPFVIGTGLCRFDGRV